VSNEQDPMTSLRHVMINITANDNTVWGIN